MVKPSLNRLTGQLLLLLRQGTSSRKLAWSLALGFGISCLPIFGTTTILCLLVALTLRLNLPAIQVGNYLALPLQLILFVPFLRLGERLSQSSPMPLSATELLGMARSAPEQAMRLLLSGQWHAILGWVVIAPEMVVLLFLLLRPAMRYVLARVHDRYDRSLVTIQR